MNRTETLQKALDAVERRPKAYGPPEQNFERIARRWNAHLQNTGHSYCGLTATDVAIMMADLKLARLEENPAHEDSWVDLAGYAACGAEVSAGDAAVTARVLDDMWVECAPGECPMDLRVGDWVRWRGDASLYREGSIVATSMGLDGRPYGVGPGRLVWPHISGIIAYKCSYELDP